MGPPFSALHFPAPLVSYRALEWPEPYSNERATAGPQWTMRLARGPPPVDPVHGSSIQK
jgi:hypothetical protein